MKCQNCGMELPGNAKFCDVCGAPVNEPVENDRTMMADEEKGYDFGAFENDPAPRRRYDDEQNNAPRYEDDFENEPPRSGYADESNYRDNAPRRTNRRYQEPPNKNKKTALIISIIALVLVIAIIGGVIFFINRNTVSAAELQEAKDKYLPPAQAVTIDTSKDDPSNDDIQFKYDDRARIISCTYMANEKPYAQRYTYDDSARKLNIETSYRERPIYTKEIEYSRVKSPNTFVNVDEYYVRLDDGSVDKPDETDAPTDPPVEEPTEELTEEPTEEPTEAPEDWKDLYIDYLNHLDTDYKTGKLIYLNNDDVPELILYVMPGAQTVTYRLCWISDGEVQSDLFDTKGYVYREYDGYICKALGNAWGGGWTRYVFDGNSLIEESSGGYDASQNAQSGKPGEKHYTVNGEEVTEEEFLAARGGDDFWTNDDYNSWTSSSDMEEYIRSFE